MTNKEIAVTGTETIPDYIKPNQCRGSENVTTEDLIIPRIELVQPLSGALSKNDAAFIEDIEVGNMYNSVTREIYPESVYIVPIIFRKGFVIWKDHDQGGGFFGDFPSEKLAAEEMENLIENGEAHLSISPTAQHFILIVGENGRLEEAFLSWARSKLQPSRALNSLVQIAGGDRFSRMYKLTTVETTSKRNGKTYQNFKIEAAGFAPEKAYKMAETIYTDLQAGTRDIKVDENFDGMQAGGDEEVPF